MPLHCNAIMYSPLLYSIQYDICSKVHHWRNLCRCSELQFCPVVVVPRSGLAGIVFIWLLVCAVTRGSLYSFIKFLLKKTLSYSDTNRGFISYNGEWWFPRHNHLTWSCMVMGLVMVDNICCSLATGCSMGTVKN